MRILSVPAAAIDARSIPADKLVHALEAPLAKPGAPDGTQQIAKRASDAMEHLDSCQLQLFLKHLLVKRIGEVGRGEIFVVGWMLDGSGKPSSFASKIYENVKRGGSIEFGGEGFLAATTPTKARDFVKWGFAVYESDKKARDVAANLEEALTNDEVKKAIKEIVQAAGGGAIAQAVVDAVFVFTKALFGLLRKNGDDQLFLFEGTGVAPHGFNAHQPGETATAENDFAKVTYAVNLVAP